MRVRSLHARRDHVVQDRPARDLGQLGLKGEVGLDVAGRLSDLDEALVALAQDFGQREALVVRHDVGDHRGAVVIGLDRVLSQPLGRPAAGAGVHGFVQQTLHLANLVVGGAAVLGRLEAHHPDHQRGDRHVGQTVDALGDAIQRLQPFGE